MYGHTGWVLNKIASEEFRHPMFGPLEAKQVLSAIDDLRAQVTRLAGEGQQLRAENAKLREQLAAVTKELHEWKSKAMNSGNHTSPREQFPA